VVVVQSRCVLWIDGAQLYADNKICDLYLRSRRCSRFAQAAQRRPDVCVPTTNLDGRAVSLTNEAKSAAGTDWIGVHTHCSWPI
jgi:hypothetical protein